MDAERRIKFRHQLNGRTAYRKNAAGRKIKIKCSLDKTIFPGSLIK